MGFINDMLGIDLPWTNNDSSIQALNEECTPIEVVGYRKLAIEIAIDLIGNSVSRVNWREFKQGKQKDDAISYILNSRPNQYSTKQAFFKAITRKLLLDREVLLIQDGNRFHIADSFTADFVAFNKIKFTNVQVNGFPAPKREYTPETAVYINYENERLAQFLIAYQSDYDQLVQSATNGYQSNKLRKYYLTSDAYRAQNTKVQADFNSLVEQNFKAFINSTRRASVYAKPKGYEIEKLEDAQQETANDVRNLIKDVIETTGNAFHVPPALMLDGNVTQVQTDNYLMFAVYPIVDAFVQGFNNYMYSEAEIRKDTLVKADMTQAKIVDLKTTADFISKVFPTGALTLEDVIVKYLNLDKPPKDVGKVRVITKNYDKVESFIEGKTESNPTVETVEYENIDSNNDESEESQNDN